VGLARAVVAQAEERERSFWWPYLASIQGTVLATLELSEARVSALRGTLSYPAFQNTRSRYMSMRERICEEQSRECAWAIATLGSRPLQILAQLSFVPVVDLLNRANGGPPNAEVHVGESKVGVVALREILPGEAAKNPNPNPNPTNPNPPKGSDH
jgi:hypothetical protein